MGIFDDAVPGGNVTKPLMIALGALLVGKLLTGKSSESEPASVPPPAGASTGGLGGLLESLNTAGLGAAVESWLNPGAANHPVDPGSLKKALGDHTLRDLAAKSGMSEQELLTQLAQALPGLIDKLTPNGQVPSQSELESLLKS